MTVGGEINGKLECHWFNQNGGEYTLKSDLFHAELLKAVTSQ